MDVNGYQQEISHLQQSRVFEHTHLGVSVSGGPLQMVGLRAYPSSLLTSSQSARTSIVATSQFVVEISNYGCDTQDQRARVTQVLVLFPFTQVLCEPRPYVPSGNFHGSFPNRHGKEPDSRSTRNSGAFQLRLDGIQPSNSIGADPHSKHHAWLPKAIHPVPELFRSFEC